MNILDERKGDLKERKKKDIGILKSSFWIIIGGIIGAIAVINAYYRYFMRFVLRVLRDNRNI